MSLALRLSACFALAVALVAAPPAPKEHFGFDPGDDHKLAGFSAIHGYFQKLAATSDRIKLEEFGRSSEGRPMIAAFISTPENLRQLERWKDANRRLALGLATREEAARLAAESKAIVWIDSGLHATEVAPAQHSPHLAYQMITGESDEHRRIRENVILIQVPVINPDGLDMVADWYSKNVGTPYELAPLPKLYQKYSGHDNNRDYFMYNLAETRAVGRMLFRTWYPQIVYNQHQQGPNGARFTIPPYAEPLNPNIPAQVMPGISLIGLAIHERLAAEGKGGVQSYAGYDAWWNGGLRSAPAFHNMHGILTEAALHGYATPKDFQVGELQERMATGVPSREPSVFQPIPWRGGRWGVREAIDYMLTADYAILELAAARREHFLRKAYDTARGQIESGSKGKPFAYVLSVDQHDPSAGLAMVDRLLAAGLEARHAKSPFAAGGKSYASGSIILPAAQAFRGYLVDLMEPQRYPEIRTGQTGPTKRPYDIAGWTLPYQMGVAADRIEEPFEVIGEPVSEVPKLTPPLERRLNASFISLARLLERGTRVRWAADGETLVEGQAQAASFAKATWELARPRVALYEPYVSNMDTGWTQWMLDNFSVKHTLLNNEQIRAGNLKAAHDAIILASQSLESLQHGRRAGERQAGRSGRGIEGGPAPQQRPEFTGGLGLEGLAALQQFVSEGGTLLTFDSATELPLEQFPIGVRGLLRDSGESSAWYCPGSVLRVTVDSTHPLAFGMPKDAMVTSTGGQAFDITMLPEFNKGERAVRPVVWYAKKDLLASGWVSGDRAVLGRPAMVEARLGKGRVVLYGFRPQFRGQSFGTFKLILNALYLSAAKEL